MNNYGGSKSLDVVNIGLIQLQQYDKLDAASRNEMILEHFKRLLTELAVIDNPTARDVILAQEPKLRRAANRPHKPHLDEMGIALSHEMKPARPESPRSKLGKPGMRGVFRSNKRR